MLKFHGLTGQTQPQPPSRASDAGSSVVIGDATLRIAQKSCCPASPADNTAGGISSATMVVPSAVAHRRHEWRTAADNCRRQLGAWRLGSQ